VSWVIAYGNKFCWILGRVYSQLNIHEHNIQKLRCIIHIEASVESVRLPRCYMWWMTDSVDAGVCHGLPWCTDISVLFEIVPVVVWLRALHHSAATTTTQCFVSNGVALLSGMWMHYSRHVDRPASPSLSLSLGVFYVLYCLRPRSQ